MFPVALLRIYLGWSFLQVAWGRFQGDYLNQPRIAAAITDWSPSSRAPEWYKDFLDHVVVPNWQFFAYCVVYFGFLVGVSYIFGFFVRPISILAAIITLNFVIIGPSISTDFYKIQLVLFLGLAWLGAGRCMGLDYYFYKRDRDIWW